MRGVVLVEGRVPSLALVNTMYKRADLDFIS